jgi:hypothetical protein
MEESQSENTRKFLVWQGGVDWREYWETEWKLLNWLYDKIYEKAMRNYYHEFTFCPQTKVLDH